MFTRKSGLLATAFAAVLLLAAAAHGQTSGAGPLGGVVISLAVDPTNDSIVYAGTEYGGVFKTLDGGTLWAKAGTGIPANSYVAALTVDPSNSQVVYAGVSGTVYKSTNGGGTWAQSGFLPGSVRVIVVDPSSSNRVYAVTSSGVSRSANEGATWTSQSSPASFFGWGLAIDPNTPSTLYAATILGTGLLKSTDSGMTWTGSNSGLGSSDVRSVAVDPANSSNVYAAAGGSIYRSTNAGGSWTFAAPGSSVVAVGPIGSSTVYAGGYGGGLLYASLDSGSTWTLKNAGINGTRIESLAVGRASGTVYAGLRDTGVYKSTDRGSTWVHIVNGLIGLNVTSLAFTGPGASGLLAGTSGGGVFRRAFPGAAAGGWSTSNTGLESRDTRVIVVDPTNPSIVYNIGGSFLCTCGVFKSTDAGATWAYSSTGLTDTGNDWAMAVDPLTPSTVYVGTSSGVFKSTNGAGTWSLSSAGITALDIRAIAVDPVNSAIVYAVGSGGVFKSADRGVSWTLVKASPGGFYFAVVIDPVTPSTVYVVTASTVHKTTDGGASWTQGPFIPSSFANPNVAMDPKDPSRLYIGSSNGSVYRSTDAGATWTSSGSGLAGNYVLSTVVDPVNSATVYAGTTAGVYRSDDSGATWKPDRLVPTLSWPVPTRITYGTPLGAAQLNATANVPGTLSYAPPAGAVLNGGSPVLTVTFIPDDTVTYAGATTITWLTVDKASPVVSWTAPAAVPFGTAVGSPQLKATADVAGTFVYAPPLGTVLPVGTQSLSATFTPAAANNYTTVTTSTTVVVNPLTPTRTTLVSSTNPSTGGQSVTFTAAVAALGDATPTGTVVFSDNGVVLGSATLGTNGSAALTTDTLFAGTHAVSASYNGSATSAGSASNAVVQIVSGSTSSTTLTSSPNPSGKGQTVSFTASVTKSGGGTATGTVILLDGTTPVGQTALNGAGVATFSVGTLTSGVHSMTARYGGSIPVGPSLSNTVSQTVSTTLAAPAGRDVRDVAVDPLNPNIIYAATFGDGFFKSLNGGTTWTPINAGLTNLSGTALAIDPAGIVYAGTNSGLLKSTNGGSTWVAQSFGGSVFDIAIDPSNPSIIYCATGTNGVFKTVNGGVNWSSVNAGLTTLFTTSIAVDPNNPANLFLGTGNGGVFKSTDAGFTWSPANSGLTINFVWAVAVDRASPGTVYALMYNVPVFKSTNGGVGWSAIGDAGLLGSMSMAFDPVTATTLYLGSNGGGVYKSSNGSTTWVNTSSGMTNRIVQDLAIDSITPSTIYAATNGGVFKTTDSAATWQATGGGLAAPSTPSITWATPPAIGYGTPLTAAQLGATANVPGTFTYVPAAGIVLGAGSHTLTATFVPTDTNTYANASATVALTVNKAVPAVTWTTPAAITYGTPLDAAQLNAQTDTLGTFVYAPAAGARLNAGVNTLSVTFTPNDSSYETVTRTVSLTVTPLTPAVVVTGGAFTYTGTAHPAATVATGIGGTAVAGSFAVTYTPGGSTAPTNAGTYNVTAVFTSTDPNYVNASGVSEIIIAPAPAAVTVGGSFTFDGNPHAAVATATGVNGIAVTGTFTITYPAGGGGPPINAGSYSVSAAFVSTNPNYAGGSAGGSIVIQPATPVIVTTGGTFVYDAAAHPASASATGIGGVTVPGTFSFSYSGSPSAPVNAGTYSVTTTFTSSDPNYASGTFCEPCAALSGGLVGWWRGDGNARDTVSADDGILMNGTGFAQGRVGQAFSFDGTDDYVEIPDRPDQSTGTVSIAFWARRQRLDNLDIILEKGGDWTSGQTNYGVGFHSSFDQMFYFFFAGGWRGTPGVSDLEWHHYAVIATNGQANPSLYIDGVERTVGFSGGAGAINLVPSTLPLHLGAQVNDPEGHQYFGSAVLDEVTIHNRGLSVSEVGALYAAGVAQVAAGQTGVATTITILPAMPSVTVGSQTFTYNGASHAATAMATGIAGGPVSGTFNFSYLPGGASAPVNVGTYGATATFTSGDPNYTGASATNVTSVTITPATPSVAIGGSFTYDATPHAAVATAAGVNGAPVSGTFSITYQTGGGGPPIDAGTYLVSATFVSADPNYTGSSASGSIVIQPATPVTVTTGGTFAYDAASHAASATASGIGGVTVPGTFNFSYSGSPSAPVNAGTYTVTTTFTSHDPNYANTSITGSDQRVSMRSGNGIEGSQDAEVRVLSYGRTGDVTPGPAEFLQAQSAPFAYVLPPYSTYLRTLSVEPNAKWIATAVGWPPVSALYAIPFQLPDRNISSATLDIHYSVDNAVNGVFINGQRISGNSFGGDFLSQFRILRTDVASLLIPNATNWLYVNLSDYGGLAALMFSASITPAPATITITPVAPVVTTSDGTFIYSGQGITPSATVTGVQGETVTGSFTFGFSPGGSTAPVNVGSYSATASFISADPNYSNAIGNTATVTVGPATPSVAVGGTFTYDASVHAATAAALGVAGTAVPGTFTFTYALGGSSAPVNAGSYEVTAAFTSGSPNYTNAIGTGTVTITPRTPTVTVAGGTFIYDGSARAATASATGLSGSTVPGEFTFTYTPGGASPPVNAGTYTVSAFFTSSDPNYANAQSGASVLFADAFAGTALNPAFEVLHHNAEKYSVHDGLFTSTQNGDIWTSTNNYVNLFTVPNTSLSGDFEATLRYRNFNPDQNWQQLDLIAYTNDDNFVRADYGFIGQLAFETVREVDGVAATPATPYVASSGYIRLTKTGTAFRASASTDGVTFTPFLSAITYAPAIARIGFLAHNGGASFAVGAPVEIVSFAVVDPLASTATVTIRPATPTVTAMGGTFTYDAQPHPATGAASGVGGAPVPGTVAFTYTPGGTAAPVNAGSYSATGTFTSIDPNYSSGGNVAATVTIVPSTPTIAASGAFTYDGQPHAAVVTAAVGAASSVGGSFSVTYTPGGSSPPVNAGTYAVSVAFTSADPNVTNATGTGSVVITPVTPIVTVTGGTFVYDGVSHPASGTATGVGGVTVPGEFTFTYSPGGAAPPVKPAQYQATAAFTSADPNYADANATASILIRGTPRVIVGGGPFTYDGAAHSAAAVALEVTGDGVVAGTMTFVYTPGGASPPVNAGTYAVSATFVSANPAYSDVAAVTDSITINPAAPLTALSAGPFTYDGAAHAATVLVSGAGGAPVAGSLDVSYSPGGASAPVNAGGYSVTASFTTADPNYISTTRTAVLTINKAVPAIAVNSATLGYNGLPRPATARATGIGGTAVAGTFAFNYSPGGSSEPILIGTYGVTGTFTSGDPNYSNASGTGAIVITPLAPLSAITLSTDQTVYRRAQPVHITGRATSADGSGIPNIPVLVQFAIKGSLRTFNPYTDAQGMYHTTFQPAASDGGTFAVTALTTAGGATRTATRTFRIVGLLITPGMVNIDQVTGTEKTIALDLRNIGDGAFANLAYSFTVTPAESLAARVSQPVTALGAGASSTISIVVTSPAGEPPNNPVSVQLQLTGTDETSGLSSEERATIVVTLRPSVSTPILTPASATIGVNPGKSHTRRFQVKNTGFVPMVNGAVLLSGDSPPPWVSLSNSLLGNVAPGESREFQLRISPPSNVPFGDYTVPFTVTGGTSPVEGVVHINVTPSTLGEASVVVNDDIGVKVNGATVTLQGTTNGKVFQGVTDGDGRLTLSGVDAGSYTYIASAANHDDRTGTVTITADATTETSVLLSYNVVTLSFTVTPTTIVDEYSVTLNVTYSTTLPKPALQVVPYSLDFRFFPEDVPNGRYACSLDITNTHPTAHVRNVVIDASQLDLGRPEGERLHVLFDDGTSVYQVGVLPGKGRTTVGCVATLDHGNLPTHEVGNVLVQANYDYSLDGQVLEGTTVTKVPVTYVRPSDLSVSPVRFIYDKRTDPEHPLLKYDGDGFVYAVKNNRLLSLDLFRPSGAFNGRNIVAFTATKGGSNALDIINGNAQNAFWRTDFNAGKEYLQGKGDATAFDISTLDPPGEAGSTLEQAVNTLIATNADRFLSLPSFLGFEGQWSDGTPPQGFLVPLFVTTVTPDRIQMQGGMAVGGGGDGGDPCIDFFIPACFETLQPRYVDDGTILLAIDQKVRLERQAFNATLGLNASATLTNTVASIQITDAAGHDASNRFFVLVTADPTGVTHGGTVSGQAGVSWQLIPSAEAGGTAPGGMQYFVRANLSYLVSGVSKSVSTKTVTITVLPSPKLQVAYSMPFVVMPGKDALIRVTVTNIGHGAAKDLSIDTVQPRIVATTLDLPLEELLLLELLEVPVFGPQVDFNITGSSNTADSNGYLPNASTVQFGDLAPGATASGYWTVRVSRKGFFIDISSTFKHEDYKGVQLDPLVLPPTTELIPAIGGNVRTTTGSGVPNMRVTLRRDGVEIDSDYTDDAGTYYIRDLTAGTYLEEVRDGIGDLVASKNITVLGDQATNFIDFALSGFHAGKRPATVKFDPASLTQTYDGTLKQVRVNTTPPGLSVSMSYDGSFVPPILAGSHIVVATIVDSDYAGTATGVLTIGKATPVIVWAPPVPILKGTPLSSIQLNAIIAIR